jgi:hypothetical protein
MPSFANAPEASAVRQSAKNSSVPAIGHNGGPPLDSDDPAGWRLWCWRRARKRAWSAPREVALRRLERAEALGVTYREYTLEILERGRYG